MRRNVFKGSRGYSPGYVAMRRKQLRYDSKKVRHQAPKNSIWDEYRELELEQQLIAEKNCRILYKENVPPPLLVPVDMFEPIPHIIKRTAPKDGILLAFPSPESPGLIFAKILMHQETGVMVLGIDENFSGSNLLKSLGIADDILLKKLKSIRPAPLLIMKISEEECV